MVKENLETNPTPEDLTKVKPEKPETVEIEKVQLENILERLEQLEGRKVAKRASLKNKTCRVRLINNQVVVGYGKSWEERLKDGGKVLMLEVFTEDLKSKDKPHVVEFISFNETGEQVTAEIIDTKKEPIEENLGFVYAKKLDYDNYRTYETEKEVPLVNKSTRYTYKLRLPDKREIWLDEEAVN